GPPTAGTASSPGGRSSTPVAWTTSRGTGTGSRRSCADVALNVEVVSPARVLWSGEASMVSAPAADGSMGVLPGHQPVLAVLRNGVEIGRASWREREWRWVVGGAMARIAA